MERKQNEHNATKSEKEMNESVSGIVRAASCEKPAGRGGAGWRKVINGISTYTSARARNYRGEERRRTSSRWGNRFLKMRAYVSLFQL